MTKEFYNEQQAALKSKISKLNSEINDLQRQQSALLGQYIEEYEHRLPFGTRIKIKGVYKRFGKLDTIEEHICFVGGYQLKSWDTTSIHGKEEFIAPKLFQVKKDGTMSQRAFHSHLTDISFEVLTD